jgi:hypothetical protein
MPGGWAHHSNTLLRSRAAAENALASTVYPPKLSLCDFRRMAGSGTGGVSRYLSAAVSFESAAFW